jgi:predicted flap endonuclease-1-like 5' DNA nuclease
MKKNPALTKRKDLSKHEDYKRIYRIYNACKRELKKAEVLYDKAKADHRSLKKKKAGDVELKAAKGSRKMAKNYRAMWWELIKSAALHVEQWMKIYEAYPDAPVEVKPKKKKKSKKNKKSAKSKTAPVSIPSPKKVEPAIEKTAPVEKSAPKKTNTAPTKKAVSKTKPASGKAPVKKVAPATKPAPVAASEKKSEPAAKPVAKKVAVKKAAVKKAPAKKPSEKDNLKRIEGIGVGIEKLFNAAGIVTFNQLSRSTVARLQGILDKAGPHYKFANPATWPAQAKLANAGKWDELKKLQAELKGGVEQ